MGQLALDMVWKVLSRPTVYKHIGAFLFSAGFILVSILSVRFAREEVDARVAQRAGYLVIASTPAFGLPPTTPLPTVTPTPVPTATPLPLPAIRVSIPAIGVNSIIRETYPTTITFWTGEQQDVWAPVPFAVGHPDSSGYPGEGTNIALLGHNNIDGAVFLRLAELLPGDSVILYTEDSEFHYQVQSTMIIPFWGNESDAMTLLQSYLGPQSSERVTLISCWPYTSNTHRAVVLAAPSVGGNSNAP
jgi:LPXTG-site transpeptidase (sortase) family protein